MDALTLSAPRTVRVGSPVDVTASVTQGARQIPLRYPMSADWTGSPNVHIGPLSGVRLHLRRPRGHR
ncbi:hypothetical protein [Saccharothrix australiensis]|uniref:hypothetical protein n=1 Tax=Saccharothrix australiensis TaxID=2072 RepID=UPI001B86A2E1|nr:hypothetical protein [Saccharothrix australiensis]